MNLDHLNSEARELLGTLVGAPEVAALRMSRDARRPEVFVLIGPGIRKSRCREMNEILDEFSRRVPRPSRFPFVKAGGRILAGGLMAGNLTAYFCPNRWMVRRGRRFFRGRGWLK
jgi:hypothetical protein